MAKARKIAVLGVPLIALFLGALALLNLNRIIERNKSYLLSQAGRSLGRNVSVERIRVSLWKGVGVGLKNIDLSDDSAYSSESFLRATEMQVSLKLVPLIRKELQVKRLALYDPQITIIRDEEGIFNFASIGNPQKPRGGDKKAKEKAMSREVSATSLFLLPLLSITGGTLRYTDRKERIDLTVSHIDLSIEELVPGKLFVVHLSAAVLTDEPNIKLEARVALVDPRMKWVDVPLDVRITIDLIDTGKLKAAVPRMRSYLPRGIGDSGWLSVRDLRITGTLRKLRLGDQKNAPAF